MRRTAPPRPPPVAVASLCMLLLLATCARVRGSPLVRLARRQDRQIVFVVPSGDGGPTPEPSPPDPAAQVGAAAAEAAAEAAGMGSVGAQGPQASPVDAGQAVAAAAAQVGTAAAEAAAQVGLGGAGQKPEVVVTATVTATVPPGTQATATANVIFIFPISPSPSPSPVESPSPSPSATVSPPPTPSVTPSVSFVPSPSVTPSSPVAPSPPATASPSIAPSMAPSPSAMVASPTPSLPTTATPTLPMPTPPTPTPTQVITAPTEAPVTPTPGETLIIFTHTIDTSGSGAVSESLRALAVVRQLAEFTEEFSACFKTQAAAATGVAADKWRLTKVESVGSGIFRVEYTVALPNARFNEAIAAYQQYVNGGGLANDLRMNCGLGEGDVRLMEQPRSESTVLSSGVSTGAIVGAVIGAIAGATLLVLVAVVLARVLRKRGAAAEDGLDAAAAPPPGLWEGSGVWDAESGMRVRTESTSTRDEGPPGGLPRQTMDIDLDQARDAVRPGDGAIPAAAAAAGPPVGAGAALAPGLGLGLGLGAAAAATAALRGAGEAEDGAAPGDERPRRHPHDWLIGSGPVTERTPLPPEDYVFRNGDIERMTREWREGNQERAVGRSAAVGPGDDQEESAFSVEIPEFDEGGGAFTRPPPEYGRVIEVSGEESGSTGLTKSFGSPSSRS